MKGTVTLLGVGLATGAIGIMPGLAAGAGSDCVVEMVRRVEGEQIFTSGSGVIIGPNCVLTAAHVEGQSILLNGQVVRAASRTNHALPPGETGLTADLAILCFAGPLPNPCPPVYRDGVGSSITITGWGNTGTRNGTTGYNETENSGDTLREGRNRVDARVNVQIGNFRTRVLCFDFDDPNVAGNGSVPNEGGYGRGDSGGAMFGDNPTGGGRSLIGINIGMAPARDGEVRFGDFGYAVDLNHYQDWIAANCCPEPGTWAIMGAPLIWMLVKRKSRRNLKVR